jgi:hypothetical protein
MFIIGENEETDKELKRLVSLVKSEEGNFQGKKWAINISLITFLVLMNLSLPSKTRESPLGITKCSGLYWLIQLSFIFFCGIMAFVAIRLLRAEQNLK